MREADPTAPDDATRQAPGTPPPPSRGHDRLPGTVVARRWRLVAPLGRGGMGEVWRADDLKLGQPVALKFLPPELADQPRRLERLVAEARLARQIAHPNVCRVYDLGEADGQHFLSMEYVDGEDLASLLRRIGRLPREKAVDVARQLCAGLAAAHDQGVLHRDLKPANVMIDGRGRVRLADFGLAAPRAGRPGEAGGGGTPAYMAPEQLAGGEATVASDLYALGLVLYEMVTGRRPFAGGRASGEPPSRPSSVLDELDPAVERTILRCLEEDPGSRPPSALAVAAALPGGDPLAAARAAGETPSPELVAAASGGAVDGRRASRLLAIVVVGLALAVPLAARTDPALLSRLDRPPEALRDRAREVLAALGHDLPRGDWFDGFHRDRGGLATPAAGDGAALSYFYRESPRPMPSLPWGAPGDVDAPVHGLPGMTRLVLAPDGRLRRYETVPPEAPGEPAASAPAVAPGEPAAADWAPLLAAAGLDPAALADAEPVWAPPVWADRRAAWTGRHPAAREVPIRVEAAARAGRPVWFVVRDPGYRPPPLLPPARGLLGRVADALVLLWIATALAFGALLARRNLRLGRGDRRGAIRFAGFLGTATFLGSLLGTRLPSPAQALEVVFACLAYGALTALLVLIFYLATEPALRRVWPETLVSWVRLLDGRWRDRLVAQHVLAGCAGAVVLLLVMRAGQLLPPLAGLEAAPVERSGFGFGNLLELRGLRQALAWNVLLQRIVVLNTFYGCIALLLLRLGLGRTLPAVVVTIGLYTLAFAGGGTPGLVLAVALQVTVMAVVLFRWGLLALVVASWGFRVLRSAPLTLDLDLWYADRSLLALGLVLGLALWAWNRAREPLPLLGVRPAEA